MAVKGLHVHGLLTSEGHAMQMRSPRDTSNTCTDDFALKLAQLTIGLRGVTMACVKIVIRTALEVGDLCLTMLHHSQLTTIRRA
jgi:hypothetical protein